MFFLTTFQMRLSNGDTASVQFLLDGHDHALRKTVFAFIREHSLFSPVYDLRMSEQRKLNFQRMKALIWSCKDVLTRSNDVSVGLRHQATMECAAMYDHNLSVLIGVHIGLFGAAVAHLGSEKHRKYLPLIEDYTMPGCFALTELGHGSNVRGIETIATYDGEEFIIHTPSETAQKYWIGGAALWAKWSAVFANLVLGGENKGVHCFLVRIRNDDGTPVKGVQIADCGHKMGMNGVDNGRIWFDHVRIPRDNLLDRIAQVNAKGEYASKLESVEARFGATMLPLTGGRVSIAMNSINVCKIALTTAIRYSSTRKAFGPVGRPEVPILHYLSHQLRLMPLLATTYAFNFACTDLKMKYVNRDKASAKQVHVLSSGYKALASWHMARTLSECREACGGQGYKSDNRFGSLIADHNISLTFEGDNNVLLQQVSKALLSDPSARPSAPVKNVRSLSLLALHAETHSLFSTCSGGPVFFLPSCHISACLSSREAGQDCSIGHIGTQEAENLLTKYQPSPLALQ